MTDFAFVLRVLAAFDAWDGADKDDLWWRTDGEYAPVTFLLNCNDVFWWGTADCERVTPETVSVLEQATKDLRAVDPVCGGIYAGLLYCCRARGMRPQGAYYDHLDAKYWPLFDAAGPPREVNMTNPKKHPSDRHPVPAAGRTP